MISDETLTLYYYGDGLTPEETLAIDAALQTDAELAARYANLRREMDLWREPDPTPAPAHTVQRWHDSIDQAARSEAAKLQKRGPSFQFWSFAWGGAVMAAIALGFGLYFSADNAVESTDIGPLVVSNGTQETATPASFTRGLQVHLQDSRTELVNLPGNSFDDRNQLLMQIIEQNRLFERAAESNNAPEVARILRAFEPILMRLASDDIAPRDAEALRAQLAFELNVILTKLERRTSDDEQTI